jgi:hypothetical protein
MKQLLTLILTLASFAFVVPLTQTETTSAATLGKPQLRIQIGRQRRRYRDWRRDENRGERVGYGQVYTETRLVQRGFRTYRETYQVRYLPNGQTMTTLISRERVY